MPPTRLWPGPRRTLVAAAIMVAAVVVFGVIQTFDSTTDSVLTSDTSCGSASGANVDLGLQVRNRSNHTITVSGVTVHRLPATVTLGETVFGVDCEMDDLGKPAPVRLAPGQKEWIMLMATLTTRCPDDASPTMTVSYNAGSARATQTLPIGALSEHLPPCSPTSGWQS